jgi:hypothetical protein
MEKVYQMNELQTVILVFVIACFVDLILVMLAVQQIQRRMAPLTRIEAKLDLVLRNAGIEYNPFLNLPEAVRGALQGGDKILAIKRYREATGVGLREAKEFIEEVQKRAAGTG